MIIEFDLLSGCIAGGGRIESRVKAADFIPAVVNIAESFGLPVREELLPSSSEGLSGYLRIISDSKMRGGDYERETEEI